MGRTKVKYISPIKQYTDKDGNWWIKFKEKDIKKALKKFNKDGKD